MKRLRSTLKLKRVFSTTKITLQVNDKKINTNNKFSLSIGTLYKKEKILDEWLKMLIHHESKNIFHGYRGVISKTKKRYADNESSIGDLRIDEQKKFISFVQKGNYLEPISGKTINYKKNWKIIFKSDQEFIKIVKILSKFFDIKGDRLIYKK